MKIKYFSLIFLIISLFGCASTGKLNTSVPNLKVIESKKSLDLLDACTVTTSSGSYQEPYTDYENYYESEPYTAYRSESYLTPNPKYNPARAAEIEKDNSALRSELFDLKSEINLCDYFTLDWN